jgi:catechol 2,3-dioxygenase-like lactoylglutathione lyase family enzyme
MKTMNAKTHISLNVISVEKSLTWYEAFFGQPAHKRRPGYANFDIDNPALKLAIQEHNNGTGGPLNHLGILVPSTDDVLAAKSRLESAGLITFTEENIDCCFARQDKIWVRDPDGNAWEVYAIVDDMLDQPVETCCAEPSECCQPAQTQPCCN